MARHRMCSSLIILLKVLHVWLPIKLGFEKCVIIDDVNSKSPFLSGIFKAGGSTGKRFSKLIISYVARIYMKKARTCQHFLFDVIEYIKYADKRYMRDYC